MIRSALAVALVLLACLFSVSEELFFSLDPPRPGQAAPFSVRADRRFSVGSPEAEGPPDAPGIVDVPDRGCAGALPAVHGRRRPPSHPGARRAAGPGAALAIPVGPVRGRLVDRLPRLLPARAAARGLPALRLPVRAARAADPPAPHGQGPDAVHDPADRKPADRVAAAAGRGHEPGAHHRRGRRDGRGPRQRARRGALLGPHGRLADGRADRGRGGAQGSPARPGAAGRAC